MSKVPLRLKPFAPPRRYQIEAVLDGHREIIRRIATGETNTQIAADLGCTPQTVSNVRNSDVTREVVERMHVKRDEEYLAIKGRIQALCEKAVDLYESVIDDPTALTRDRLHAADQISDRGGLPKHSAITSTVATPDVYTREEMMEIRRRGIEAAREAGMISLSEARAERNVV